MTIKELCKKHSTSKSNMKKICETWELSEDQEIEGVDLDEIKEAIKVVGKYISPYIEPEKYDIYYPYGIINSEDIIKEREGNRVNRLHSAILYGLLKKVKFLTNNCSAKYLTGGKVYNVISTAGWLIFVKNDIGEEVEFSDKFWDIEELEPINTDKLIEIFEERLYKQFGLKLSDDNKKTIIKKLENHKDCMKNGKVAVVLYDGYGCKQSRRLSLECNNCCDVILDIYEKEF